MRLVLLDHETYELDSCESDAWGFVADGKLDRRASWCDHPPLPSGRGRHPRAVHLLADPESLSTTFAMVEDEADDVTQMRVERVAPSPQPRSVRPTSGRPLGLQPATVLRRRPIAEQRPSDPAHSGEGLANADSAPTDDADATLDSRGMNDPAPSDQRAEAPQNPATAVRAESEIRGSLPPTTRPAAATTTIATSTIVNAARAAVDSDDQVVWPERRRRPIELLAFALCTVAIVFAGSYFVGRLLAG